MGEWMRFRSKWFGAGTEERCFVQDHKTPEVLPQFIAGLIRRGLCPGADVLLVCIGTDRSTGDSLGPLVGESLCRKPERPYRVFGTLENPVHASNLHENLQLIENRYPSRFVIAIDACLGKLDNIGNITVGWGSLQPGAGVNKNLPPVGDMFITGTVNVGGFMEYFVLQNTRLSFVMRMASVISEAIDKSFDLLEPPLSCSSKLTLAEAAPAVESK